jgi:hypothetical protein
VFESKQKHCKVMKDDLSHPYIAIGSETIKWFEHHDRVFALHLCKHHMNRWSKHVKR